MSEFEGRWFMVTGSSRGIGRKIAEDIAAEKGNLILHGKSDSAQIQSLSRSLSAEGVEVITEIADTSKPEGIEAMVASLTSRDVKMHGLVNNAGIYTDALLSTLSMEDWNSVLDLDLRSHVFLTGRLSPLMEAGSSIVNISSVLGMKATNWGLSYQAAKSSLIHMSKSLALSLAPKIRVNCVSPGYIRTEMNEDARENEEFVRQIEKVTPLKRWGEASDISNIVLYLLSDKASFITGANFTVSGGIELH